MKASGGCLVWKQVAAVTNQDLELVLDAARYCSSMQPTELWCTPQREQTSSNGDIKSDSHLGKVKANCY